MFKFILHGFIFKHADRIFMAVKLIADIFAILDLILGKICFAVYLFHFGIRFPLRHSKIRDQLRNLQSFRQFCQYGLQLL